MLKTLALLLLLMLTVSGCASNETPPCSDSCPPPPQLPAVLTAKPVSTGPSSSQRIETLLQDFEKKVEAARR